VANRTVSVKLIADVASYQSSMQKAAAVTKDVGDKAEDSGSRIGRGFDRAKAGAVLLGGVLVGGVALGLKSVVGSASDLNETLNKSNVIFGDQAGRISQWANGAAKSFGLSKQAALEAAASFGNMFQQLGFGGTQAATMSTSVVKLAADLGSFNNLETGDVLERIQAAFRGEYDSLQLLIPNISAARVEQEALAETGKTNADQLTAQEKATATLAIVSKDGAAAMNDFSETSNGLANSTKIAAAQFEDLKSRIGQDLLPVAQSAMHFFSETALPALEGVYGTVKGLAGAFGDLPGPMQIAALAAVGWAAAGDRILGAWGAVTDKVKAFREEQDLQRALFSQQSRDISDVDRALGGLGTSLDTTGSKAGTAKAAFKGLASALGPELAVAGAVYVISDIATSIEKIANAGDNADQYIRELDHSLGQIDDNAGRISATADAIDNLKFKIEGAQDALDNSVSGANGANPLGMIELVAAVEDGQDSIDAFKNKLKELQDQQNAIQTSTSALQLQYGITSDAVVNLADKYDIDLTQGVVQVTEAFAASGAAGEIASGAIAQVGTAADMTQGQIEAAAQAQQDWINQLTQIGTAMADPLAAYQSLLDQKQAAEQAAAQATADATASSKDSWKDYVGDVSVSLDEYATKLEEQITNQENWRVNLATVAARGGVEVAQILASMGEQGVQITAQMANGTDAEFQRMAQDLIKNAQLGGTGAASELDKAMKIMAIVGQQGASATVQSISSQLNIGVADVARIAAQYGINLAGGINPLLASLGKPQVMVGGGGGRAIGQTVMNADGNLYEQHQAEIAPAGAWRVWAEPETGGEAYIPLAAAKRPRSRAIAAETVQRLGGQVQWFAGGGFTSEADIPRPSSTAPYRMPISTAGDAAMDTAFQATANFVRENGPWARALAWAKSQVGKPYIWGGVGPAGYDCSGFQSAITNVLLGRSPYLRVGATASFPWPGFAPGDGTYTIGSTKDAGGGIGHMAGTLLGTNVESRGGQGVVVGGSARGAHDPLFSTRAHLAMFNGGVIGEPVVGFGTRSGNSYSFGERGPEVVLPTSRESSGSYFGPGSGASAAPRTVIYDQRQVHAEVDARRLSRHMAADQRDMEFLHG
jgi:hypothetical protein